MITSIEQTTETLIATIGAKKAAEAIRSFTPCRLLGRDYFDSTEISAAIEKIKKDPKATFEKRSPVKIDVMRELEKFSQNQ